MKERDVIVVYLKDTEGQLKLRPAVCLRQPATQLSRLHRLWSNHEITILGRGFRRNCHASRR